MEPSSAFVQRRARFEERSRRYEARGYDRVAVARFVAAVLDSVAGEVLDVGTGKGLLALALAARGLSVVTVDPDPAEQELAAWLGREAGVEDHLHIVTGDAGSLPYADGHFSAAASLDALHHLTDPLPILKEMVRTLRPDGAILLADFSREGFDLVASVHREEGRMHPESGVTIDDAAAVLRECGFGVALRFTKHLHDIAVFARHADAVGQSALRETRRLAHAHCLVCGAENPGGLRLNFAVQPDRSVHAVFEGGASFQGYPDAMHGGLIATLLDSAMTNCLFSSGVVAVTARLNVRYVEPGRWHLPCAVRAKVDRSSRGVHYLSAEVRQEGRVIARATGTFANRPCPADPVSTPVHAT